jgi:gliding motility-associated-like protein
MKKITLLIFTLFLSFAGYAQFPIPGTEGFESTTGPTALPFTDWPLGTGNWAVFDNGVGLGQRWGINNGVASPPLVYAGTNAAYINRENIGIGNTSEDYLATPLITIPTNGQLRFFARTFTNGNTGTIYQVKIAPATASQTNPAAYTTIIEYNENELTVDVDGVQNPFNVYTEKVIDIPTTFGTQVYVAFVMKYTQTVTGISGDRWLLDNVRIAQKCLDPTTLTAANIVYNQADLSWANPSGATSWEIEVIPVASAATGTGVTYSGTLPYVATGLTANTSYKYYVRALCGDGINSEWVGPFIFNTPIAPPICGGNYLDPGLAANYPSNANTVVTICPVTPGDVVTVTFTAFNTEATFDGLYVFNGNTTSAPQITSTNPAGSVPGGLAGSFWGTSIPGPFTSSSADGCLTFRFRSNGTTTASGWTSNITCGPPPSCPKPISVTRSGLTATSVILGWTNTGTATQWEVLALPCGSPTPTAASTGFVAASTNPFTLGGLTPDTCYDFYVRAVCNTTAPQDVSEWSTAVSGTTLQVTPACGTTFSDPGGSSGNYANNTNYTVTICPITAGDVVTVIFTSFNTQATADGLYIYNGNTTTAPLISSGNPAGTVPGGQPGAYWGTTNPGVFTSSSADGCLTFRFRSGASTNAPGWTSNITCGPPPTCPQPQSFITSAVTHNSVNLAWTETGTATSWQVLAVPCGSPFPTASSTGWVTAGTNPYTLTGLTPETCYDIYIRSACSSSDVSNWAGPRPINTLIAPPVCGGTFVDPGGTIGNYGNNANVTWVICPSIPGELVTVTFTSFALENNFDFLNVYDGDSATATLLGTYTGGTLPPQIEANSANGCLTFVFTSDASGVSSGWNANVTCGPPPTCPKPINLVATPLTVSTVNLTWIENGTATSWEVIIQPAGSGVPPATATGTIVSTTSYTATGLTAGVNYEFWVRAICSSTDISNWNGPKTFVLVTTCNDALPFCGSTPPYTNTTNIPSLGSPGCLGSTPNPAWYVVQIENSGPITFTLSQATTSGTPIDVDFIVWGPLTAPACTGLYDFPDGNTSFPTNIVDCSYSASALEFIDIPNAISGQFYLVLITNFSNQAGTVTFTQTSGTGTTGCPCTVDLGPDVTVCGTTYTITATSTNSTGYAWYNGADLIAGETSSTLTVTSSGTYKCVIQCGVLDPVEDTINVVLTTPIAPTFDPISSLCQNATAPILPLTSNNGITGTWSPAIIDTSIIGIATYDFTPDATPTQTCVTNVTVEVTITAPITPTFDPIPNVCQNTSSPTLPLVSTNGISGSWSPATIDSSVVGTVTYTFTPDTSAAGQSCALPSTLDVTVIAPTITTFTPISNICIGGTAPVLPTGSLEGITGTWLPATIDTSVAGTSIYTFTPDAGICATTATLSVTIDALTASIFTPIATLCQGATAPALPTTSNNGYTGSWSPATIDTSVVGTFPITFTPDAGQCADTATLSVTIVTPTVATFTQIAPICSGTTAPTLPLTSTNGITGTWSPSTIDTSVAGTFTYTFTTTSACVTGTTMNIVIVPTPVIAPIADVNECDSYTLPTLATGNYFTGTAGTGTPLAAGTVITSTQPIYVYAVNGTSPDTCSDEESFVVTIVSSPQFTIDGGCDGGAFVLEVISNNFDTGSATYTWTNAAGAVVGTNSPTLTVTSAGDYTCQVTLGSCDTSVLFEANAISCLIPKGISPNNDSKNDEFDLTGYNVKQLSIFNRYGTKVYSKSNYTNQWFGQSDKGDELPDGTYYYVIERDGMEAKTGWVYINREIN